MNRVQLGAPPENKGRHNSDLETARGRLLRGGTYRDCSTVIVIPAIAPIAPKVVQAYMGLLLPMNQRCTRLFVEHCEVGDAYNQAVESILAHPELSKWKYLLTMETDNLPPPDGLLKLIEDIETPIPGGGGQKWAAVGGLYWTKGEVGQPMCYGQPEVMPKNFIPWLPPSESVTECNGLGMGFTLFRLSLLASVPPPRFQTVQRYTPGVGTAMFTQDLHYFQEAAKYGHRFACSTRVLVGHFDSSTETVW